MTIFMWKSTALVLSHLPTLSSWPCENKVTEQSRLSVQSTEQSQLSVLI